ncbi:AbfB domain-containing protein [Nonomuraea angiospora]|uniref:AbfB domain-containing protein n=1 Tax=Nonomuraea angiospora TaxID=46172 RepID=UPI00344BED24
MSSDAQTRQDATFTIVTGLAAPNGYSLRAADGRYLRHRGFELWVDAYDGTAGFRDDSSFTAWA